MKEARFVSQNKEKWGKMENVSHLDTDTLASNYVILSDDLSYAKTFYPGSDVVKYLNQLISVYQINIYGQERSGKRGFFPFGAGVSAVALSREADVVVCFSFSSVCGIDWGFLHGKRRYFRTFDSGDAYVDKTLENIENGTPMGIYSSSNEVDMFFMITANNIKVAFVAFVFGIFFPRNVMDSFLERGYAGGFPILLFPARAFVAFGDVRVGAWDFRDNVYYYSRGQGLVMGNSFLFPGTYKRSYSFRNGALRGIKIVTGLIPFFIIAGWIESFITRYADAYPVVGAAAIILSLGGVIGYFVVYPYYLHKTETNGKD